MSAAADDENSGVLARFQEDPCGAARGDDLAHRNCRLLAEYLGDGGLLFRDPVPTIATWAGVTALQLVAGVFAFRLERERLRPLWLLPLQQIVYRQLMYAVLLQSAVTAFAGVRLRWQELQHRGDFTAAPFTCASTSSSTTEPTRPLPGRSRRPGPSGGV